MTSEETHGITQQPPPTCPLIDDAIADVRKVLSLLKNSHKMELEELRNACDSAEWAIDNLLGSRGHLESIRERTSAIREWGEEWKQLALTKETK